LNERYVGGDEETAETGSFQRPIVIITDRHLLNSQTDTCSIPSIFFGLTQLPLPFVRCDVAVSDIIGMLSCTCDQDDSTVDTVDRYLHVLTQVTLLLQHLNHGAQGKYAVDNSTCHGSNQPGHASSGRVFLLHSGSSIRGCTWESDVSNSQTGGTGVPTQFVRAKRPCSKHIPY
jgi:hypothetical protein